MVRTQQDVHDSVVTHIQRVNALVGQSDFAHDAAITESEVVRIEESTRCGIQLLDTLLQLVEGLSTLATGWDHGQPEFETQLQTARSQWLVLHKESSDRAAKMLARVRAWRSAHPPSRGHPPLSPDETAHIELVTVLEIFRAQLSRTQEAWNTQTPRYHYGMALHIQNAHAFRELLAAHPSSTTTDQLERMRLAEQMLSYFVAAKRVLVRQLRDEPAIRSLPAFGSDQAWLEESTRCGIQLLDTLLQLVEGLSTLATGWDHGQPEFETQLQTARSQWLVLHKESSDRAAKMLARVRAWRSAHPPSRGHPPLSPDETAHIELVTVLEIFRAQLSRTQEAWNTQTPRYHYGMALHIQNAHAFRELLAAHPSSTTTDQLERMRLAEQMLSYFVAAKRVLVRQLRDEPAIRSLPAFGSDQAWLDAEWKTTFRGVDDMRKATEAHVGSTGSGANRLEFRRLEEPLETQRQAFWYPSL